MKKRRKMEDEYYETLIISNLDEVWRDCHDGVVKLNESRRKRKKEQTLRRKAARRNKRQQEDSY